MKRHNIDDSSTAKRQRVMEGFEKLEREILEAYKDKRYEKVIDLCQTVLKIDFNHPNAHYFIGMSIRRTDSKEYLKILNHLKIHLAINGDEDNNRRFYSLCFIGLSFCNLKLYQNAVSYFRKALEDLDLEPFPSRKSVILWYLVESCKLANRHIECSQWSHELIKYNLQEVWIEKQKEFFENFCIAYETCYPEEAKKMTAIINDPNAFKFLLGDAYKNWNMLTRVHQKHIERSRPKEYKHFCAFSSLMKSFLHNMNLEFTDITIDIIHSFLFLV